MKKRITISIKQQDYQELVALGERYDRSLSWLAALAVQRLIEDEKSAQLTLPLGNQLTSED